MHAHQYINTIRTTNHLYTIYIEKLKRNEHENFTKENLQLTSKEIEKNL